MLFNSFDFGIFLPIVFAIYWILPSRQVWIRNSFILAASYYFYAAWDVRFLALIFASSVVDFVAGLVLARNSDPNLRKLTLLTSLVINLGCLGFFKYYNFFIESFAESVSWFGVPVEASTLRIILPAGISFYTFQTLSYTIDVYRNRLRATSDPISFFAFVSFFPQLVAGPIERAEQLLPQFSYAHSIDADSIRSGLRQFLWGLFKKVVIADNCGRYVESIFRDYDSLPASALWIGSLLFAFQIYGDFSGYSDMAIGSARLFGFQLSRNFKTPYLAVGLVDFWRRWHISLSTWFRDYVYVPLGGRQESTFITYRNLTIVFLLSGLWHGAAWTFVLWGAFHAMGYVLSSQFERRLKSNVGAKLSWTRAAGQVTGMLLTFLFVTAGWVIFRSRTVGDAIAYYQGMFNDTIFTPTEFLPPRIIALIGLMMAFEFYHRDREHGIDFNLEVVPKWIRWIVYQLLVFGIISFGVADQSFIYFQF